MAKKFIQYFEDSFRENWELPAMTNYVTKQTYAYKDVAREVAKLHILFKELNITQDDKIALVGNNSPEWAITFLATITYGAVIVPILQDFHPDDIAHIIEHSEAKLMFVDELYWNRLEDKSPINLKAVFSLMDLHCMREQNCEEVPSVQKLHSLFLKAYPKGIQKDNLQYSQKDDSEMCVLNYTSGTSGLSKGVMLTSDNFCCLFEYAVTNNLGETGDKVISIVPMSHAYGCVNDFFYPFIAGGQIIFIPHLYDSKILQKAMREVQPDYISIVPLVLETIYKRNIHPQIQKKYIKIGLHIPIVSKFIASKIRTQLMNAFGGKYKNLFIAGAGLNKNVENFLVKIKFPYTLAYGMTECSPIISLNCHEMTPYSVGRPIKGVTVKIDSKDPNEVPGEFLVKGRNVMKGYYKDEKATQLMFTTDGWLKTGDMGVMDKQGNLYVKGRCKSMILTSSGQNIYPENIESKINNDIHIKESVVVLKDNKIVALVYPDYDIIDKNIKKDELNVLLNDCRKSVNKKIAAYEFINEFIIQEKEFEKTPKKTIKRYLYELS